MTDTQVEKLEEYAQVFLTAASMGQVEKLEEYAQVEKLKLKEKDRPLYERALRFAVNNKKIDVVKWLVDAYNNTAYTRTAVNLFAQNGDLKLASDLLSSILIKPIEAVSHHMQIIIAAAKSGKSLESPSLNAMTNLSNNHIALVIATAMQHGKVDKAKEFISKCSTILSLSRNVPNVVKLINFSASKTQLDVLESLAGVLPQSTDSNQREKIWNQQYVTPLYLAAQSGSESCLKFALEYWPKLQQNVNAVYFHEGFTALHVAAYHGHKHVVWRLRQIKDCRIDVKDILGRTALHYAALQGHLSVVPELITDGFNIGDPDCYGMTPLHLAACAGHTNVVRKLLEHCKNLEITASSWKARAYKFQNLEWLFNYENENYASFRYGLPSTDTLQDGSTYRLESKYFNPPRIIDSVFWSAGDFTPMHFAAALGHERVVQELNTGGSFSHERDAKGMKPEDWAELASLQTSTDNRKSDDDDDSKVQTMSLLELGKESQADILEIGRGVIFMKELHEFEKKKREMKWCLDMSQALMEHNIDVAEELVLKAKVQKLNINNFGDRITQVLESHLFPEMGDMKSEKDLRIKTELEENKEDIHEDTSKRAIEGLITQLLHIAKFPTDVMERFLKYAIWFDFQSLAYHLIVNEKVYCIGNQAMSWNKRRAASIQATENAETLFELASRLKRMEMQKWMLQRDDVTRGMYENRQVYLDYANTVLVGAVLIAAAAYQGWLQPPMLHDNTKVARRILRVFWWVNYMSFSFAVATVIVGGVGAIPISEEKELVHAVKRVRDAVAMASILLVICVIFIITTFGAAGLAVLPLHWQHFRLTMYITMGFGATLCAFVLCWFIRRLLDLMRPTFPQIDTFIQSTRTLACRIVMFVEPTIKHGSWGGGSVIVKLRYICGCG